MAIANLDGARERAEDLLQNLQTRARTLLDSDTAQSLRSVWQDNAVAAQARRVVGSAVTQLKASPVGHVLTRAEVEKLAHRVARLFPVALKGDLLRMSKQVKNLNKKINDLSKKIDSSAQVS